MKKINVVSLKLNEEMKMMEMKNELEDFQGFVGGYIEVLTFFIENKNFVIVLNEEGKLENLPRNFLLFKNGEAIDLVVGNVLIVKTDGEDFVSMTKDDYKKIEEKFIGREIFELM